MTGSNTPWELPLAGTETEQLVGALDRLRTTFRWKAGHLDGTGLQTRIGASGLTVAGLLKHLAFVEDVSFASKLSGARSGAPWDATDRADWAFTAAADDSPQQLYSLRDGAVERRGPSRWLAPVTEPDPVGIDLECTGELWHWRGPSPYYFVTVPEPASRHLHAVSTVVTYGWGMIPVTARIGSTEWTTLAVPQRRDLPRAGQGRRTPGREARRGRHRQVRLTVAGPI